MKKIAILLFCAVVCLPAFAQDKFDNCFGIIAGKQTTADGSVLFAHNEDDSGEPMLNVFITKKTGDKASYIWCELPGYEVADGFMNEYGVAVASDYCPSVEDKNDVTDGGVVYQVRVNVARYARTAREGAKIVGETVEKYGYSATGRTYLIADSNEGWMVSVVKGRHWVAMRVPDDKVMVIPNNYIIDRVDLSDTANFLGSKDLIEYAKLRGWYSPSDGEFSFKKAYGNNARYHAEHNTHRQRAAVEYFTGEKYSTDPDKFPLCISPVMKVTVQDMINVLSIHSDKKTNGHNGLICSNSTAYSTIFQLRSGLPVKSGNIMWLCCGHPCVEPYIPWYLGMTKSPAGFTRYKSFEQAEQMHFEDKKGLRKKFPDCYYWRVVDMYEYVDKYWETGYQDAHNNRDVLQKEIFKSQEEFDSQIHSFSGDELARKLNKFTASWYK